SLQRDATGSAVWLLQRPDAVQTALRPRRPEYAWAAQDVLDDGWVITSYAADADPILNRDLPVQEARLVVDDAVAATWSPEAGFSADPLRWQELIPTSGRSTDNPMLLEYFPPHIVLSHANGDVRALLTAHGRLDALQDPSAEAVELFLTQAAEVLPDAGHLDLIGQYLLRYVYDSPDPTMPFVPGTRTISSDIHQTAVQTLLTSVGGVCRGDCDDLSELYHNILERQGKLPHVVSLPAHAACAWAVEEDDGWHVFVLQTGRALEFIDERLPDALVAAYRFFGPEDTIDPNGLGLLLRFSGENTRSSWRLSWRIFAEPDYAETMIDVQRDWHFQTYARAIDKMQRLIEDGDHDNANYRELAGLYNFTGQFDLAAEYLAYARDLTEETESRVYMTSEIIAHWAEADKGEQARRELDRLLDGQLPALGEKLATVKTRLGLELLGTLINSGMTDAAGRIADELLADDLEQQTQRVISWATTNFDRNLWQTNDFLRQMRFMLRWYVGLAVDVLEQSGAAAVHQDSGLHRMADLSQRWMRHLAPLDADDPSEYATIYAVIGDYYAATLGEQRLLELLAETAFPEDATRDHSNRLGPDLQLHADLPWIKQSVTFWWNQLADRFQHGKPTPETADILALSRAADLAYQHVLAQDLVNPRIHHQAHLAALVNALYGQDAERLRELLQDVAHKNDKRLRDDTAQWLGDAAKGLDLDWYQRVLAIWRDELDYKPKYYWIAWRAMLNEAPEHALLVAELAAGRFADDPAFVEELHFLRELADPQTRYAIDAEARQLLAAAPEEEDTDSTTAEETAQAAASDDTAVEDDTDATEVEDATSEPEPSTP
ncbi:MAG: hypothetical protein ACOCXJ_07205, partial [Planctomycetota bacterium]